MNAVVKAKADYVRQQGEGEDDHLVHMSSKELELLRKMWGEPRPNPKTGLPSYGWFSDLLTGGLDSIGQVASTISQDPTRALFPLGGDPLGTKVYDTITGKNDPAIFGWNGGISPQLEQNLTNKGVNLGPYNEVTAVGDIVAGYGAGSALTGALGAADGATGAAGAGAGDIAGGASTAVDTSLLPADLASAGVDLGAAGDLPAAAGDLGEFITNSPSGTGLSSLTPELANMLGIAPAAADIGQLMADNAASVPGAITDTGAPVDQATLQQQSGWGTGPTDPSLSQEDLQAMSGWTTDPSTDSSNALLKYLKSPKNLASAGLTGFSLLNALSKPKLPGYAQTAGGSASSIVQSATPVIQSGGTATPAWTQQKASIDASITQQFQQQSEQLMQAAQNSGMGGNNSAVVQQQLNTLRQNLETQRQQLYLQAQQQNVQAAVQELTGGDQILSSLAQMQLLQSAEARQVAGETAQLALLLQQLGGG